MTLTQLEYVVALDTHRHFMLASEKCFVTQPTLSMQIQKLEEELGVKIFDRTKQPVIPTEIGARIITQARVILREAGGSANNSGTEGYHGGRDSHRDYSNTDALSAAFTV